MPFPQRVPSGSDSRTSELGVIFFPMFHKHILSNNGPFTDLETQIETQIEKQNAKLCLTLQNVQRKD